MTKENSPSTELTLFSRRAVFKLGAIVGASCFLGSALGGRVCAYADEEGTPYFVVTIVAPDEIAVRAYDVTTDPAQCLAGFAFTITSHSVDASISGTTNQEGVALLNIRNLCVTRDEDDASDFAFFGEVSASKDGYRDYATGNVMVKGGIIKDGTPSVSISSQPFEASRDKAYLRRATFDGSDIQYEETEVALYSTYEDVEYAFEFQVVGQQGSQIGCRLVGTYDGADTELASSTQTASEGITTFSFSDTWIKRFDGKAGMTFKVEISVDGSVLFTANLKLKLLAPQMTTEVYPGPYQKEGGTFSFVNSMNIDPNTSQANYLGAKSPEPTFGFTPWYQSAAIDCLGGAFFPISVRTTPATSTTPASLIISGTLTICKWEHSKDSKGETKDSLMGVISKDARQKYRDYYKNKADSWKETINNYKNRNVVPADHNETSENGLPFKFAFDLSIGVFAEFDWTDDESFFFGGGGASVDSKLSVTVEGQFVVVSVPVFIGLTIAAETVITQEFLDATLNSVRATEFKNSASGKSVYDLSLTLTFFAGVGFEGLLALGVKGYGKLGTVFTVEYPTNSASFHGLCKLTAGAKLFAQLLWCTIEKEFAHAEKVLWDSSDKSSAGTPQLMWGDEKVSIVTDEALLGDENTACSTSVVGAGGLFQNVVTSKLFNGTGSVRANGDAQSDASTLIGKALKNPDILDPNASNSPYELRRGARPTLVQAIQANTFSDPRTKFVQIGETLHVASIVKHKYVVSADADFMVAHVPLEGCDGGRIYAIPKTTIEAAKRLNQGSNDIAVASSGLHATLARDFGENFEKLKLGENPFKVPAAVANSDVPVALITLPVTQEGDDAEADDLATYQQRAAGVAKLVSGESDVEWVAALLKDSSVSFADPSSQEESYERHRIQITHIDLNTQETVGDTEILDFVIPANGVKASRQNLNDYDFEMRVDGDNILFGVISAAANDSIKFDYDEDISWTFSNALVYAPPTSSAETGKITHAFSNLHPYDGAEGDYEWRSVPVRIPSFDESPISLVTAAQVNGEFGFTVHNYYSSASDYYNGTGNTFSIVPKDTASAKLALSNMGTFDVMVNPKIQIDYLEPLIIAWQYGDTNHREETYDSTGRADSSMGQAAVWAINAKPTSMKAKERIVSGSPQVVEGPQSFSLLGANRGFAYLVPRETDPEGLFDLKRVTVSSTDGKSVEFAEETMGVTQVSDFLSVDNGNYLFVQRGMEGEVPKLDADAYAVFKDDDAQVFEDSSCFAPDALTYASRARVNEGLVESEAAEAQTLCCRWDPLCNRYRQFFPHTHLSTNPIQTSAFRLQSATLFFNTVLTNSASQEASVISVTTPDVKNLTIQELYCFDGFVAKGKAGKVHPVVTIVNDGNLPVRGFTLNFTWEGESKPFASVPLENLEKYVIKTDEPRDLFEKVSLKANDELQTRIALAQAKAKGTNSNGDSGWSDDDDAILWPGSTRQYKVEVETPAKDSGIFHVTCKVSDLVEPDFDGQSALFASEDFSKAVMVKSAAPVGLDLFEVVEDSTINLCAGSANNYVYADDPGKGDSPSQGGGQGGSSSGSSGSSGSGSGSSASTAKTGDNAAALAAALVGLAGVATAGAVATREKGDSGAMRDQGE